MLAKRFKENPLVVQSQVKPSRADFEVTCAFNAAAIKHENETLLLLRVAERAVQRDGYVSVPVLKCEDNGDSKIEVLEFSKADTKLDYSDPRVIFYDGMPYLTTISHLRLARSKDGVNFVVEDKPALIPERRTETYGIEDSRITKIGDTYYIQYKSVSYESSINVTLATTKDFVNYEKGPVIFCPENLDVAIFPDKVNGKYAALHRPISKQIGQPCMWLAYSPDLLHWGYHELVMQPRAGKWDSGRIGASAVPIKTEKGWLEIYHGATDKDVYCLGAVLLDLDNPAKVIARSEEPIIAPCEDYETQGFLPNVIFSCGATMEDDGDTINVYYGAADHITCGAQFSLQEIFKHLGV